MNIDERLEALTQSVELLTSFHTDHQSRLEKLEQISSELRHNIAQLTEIHAVMAALLKNHEDRIERMEGR